MRSGVRYCLKTALRVTELTHCRSVAVGDQMATSGTQSSAPSGNIVSAADSADALYATDHDGRSAVLALDQARNVSNASDQLIS